MLLFLNVCQHIVAPAKNVSEANANFAHGKMKNEREEELPRLGENIFKNWLHG